MNKKIVKTLLKVYSTLRTFSSPWIFKHYYQVPIEKEVWGLVKNLPLFEFSKRVNNIEYKWDIGRGFFDCSFSASQPNYFFQDLEKGRDCDDYARIWRLWTIENGMKAYEYIILDSKKPFNTSHFITFGETSEGKFWLFNYTPYGPFESLDLAKEKMNFWYDKETVLFQEYNYLKEKN